MRLFAHYLLSNVFRDGAGEGAGAGTGAGSGTGAGAGTGETKVEAGAGAGGAPDAAAAAAAAAAATAGTGAEKPGAGAGTAKEGTGAGTGKETIGGGSEPGRAAAAVQPAFGEKWREDMAGGDKALLSVLGRYASPAAYAKAAREQQLRIDSGELKAVKAPPKDASPEQLAAWRKDQGIPEKPELFVSSLKLADGIVPGEADKPLLEGFAKRAHELGWSQDRFNEASSWYFEQQAQAAALRQQQDQVFHDTSLAELAREWGPEMKANQNAIQAVLTAHFPAGVGDMILSARLPDGSLLGDNPNALRGLVALGRDLNPVATLTGQQGAGGVKAMATEKAELEKQMGDQGSAYWRGAKLPGSQETAGQRRYNEIVEAELKLAGRKAA